MMNKVAYTPISTEQEYMATIQRVHILMKKGESNLNTEEEQELQLLSLAVEKFEDTFYPLPKPTC